MRQVLLLRGRSGDQGTEGFLTSEGLLLCTMEPPWRDNRRNVSCIPSGRYEVVPHVSPRHRRCLLVTQVPGRSHILFHKGNLGGDEGLGWTTHTAGCILPGLRRGEICVSGKVQDAVLSSRTAFRHLMEWAGGDAFELIVTEG